MPKKSLDLRDFNHFTFVASIKSKLVNLLYTLETDNLLSLEDAAEITCGILTQVIDFEEYFTETFLDNREKKRKIAMMKEAQ